MGKDLVREIRKRSKAAKARIAVIRKKADITKYCRSIVSDIIDNACDSSVLQSGAVQSDNEYNFASNLGSKGLQEYNSICEHELTFEKVPKEKEIEGYRIVAIDQFFTKSLSLQTKHNRRCTGGNLEFFSEKRKGLFSRFIFKCNICDREEYIDTDETDEPESNNTTQQMPTNPKVNVAVVWGTLSTGSSYAHLSELLSVLHIPTISGTLFFEIQRELGSFYKESLWENMEQAGKQEFALAIENGDVDADGIPFITVNLDGGWSKRSYGHNYNAASGVAVIIGRRTGKILFLGVRNKYCSICARNENKGISETPHLCFKNYTGSSAGMESDIIVEGFQLSVQMHNLRYKKFIADGDSTVFARIKQKVSYGSQVEKIECVNHCIKNYSKHLYRIKGDTKGVSLAARKLLSTERIQTLVRNAQKAIYANAHGDLAQLKKDLRNSILCSFNNHCSCQNYLCGGESSTSQNLMEELTNSGAHHHIFGALNSVIAKSPQLVDNETNNRAELFMSILARFNMGKRLNLIQRDAFQTRSFLSALRYNSGQSWHQETWKKYFNKSPGRVLKTYMARQDKESTRKRMKSPKARVVKKLKFEVKGQKPSNKEYGSNIAELNLSPEYIQEETKNILDRLSVTNEDKQRIANATIGQFDNPVYVSERQLRLTASHFGSVIKRRPTTSCDALVKFILKPHSLTSTAAMDYGKKNEIVAIRRFEEITGKKVLPAGLHVDVQNGFLGASPDGIINENEIVEVKCLYKVVQLGVTLVQATRNNQISCLEVNSINAVQLRRNHNYYFQIQGQLALTGAKQCFFIVYTGDKNELFWEEIKFDANLWNLTMLPKLKDFYLKCMLPNIIEDRPARGLKCKDPPEIQEAQRLQESKKKTEKKKSK